MSNTPQKNIGVNKALREAGFVPLPRWWVTRDELSEIHSIAHKHEAEITRIRTERRSTQEASDEQR